MYEVWPTCVVYRKGIGSLLGARPRLRLSAIRALLRVERRQSVDGVGPFVTTIRATPGKDLPRRRDAARRPEPQATWLCRYSGNNLPCDNLPPVDRDDEDCHSGAPRRGEPGIHTLQRRLWIPGSRHSSRLKPT